MCTVCVCLLNVDPATVTMLCAFLEYITAVDLNESGKWHVDWTRSWFPFEMNRFLSVKSRVRHTCLVSTDNTGYYFNLDFITVLCHTVRFFSTYRVFSRHRRFTNLMYLVSVHFFVLYIVFCECWSFLHVFHSSSPQTLFVLRRLSSAATSTVL